MMEKWSCFWGCGGSLIHPQSCAGMRLKSAFCRNRTVKGKSKLTKSYPSMRTFSGNVFKRRMKSWCWCWRAPREREDVEVRLPAERRSSARRRRLGLLPGMHQPPWPCRLPCVSESIGYSPLSGQSHTRSGACASFFLNASEHRGL